jgi:hypothetical protein
MLLYALGAAFVLGLLRWPVWSVPLLAAAAVVVSLCFGSSWDFAAFKPFNNPIFVDLVLKLGLANFVACALGYGVGRLIAGVWRRRLARATPSAGPPAGPGPHQ